MEESHDQEELARVRARFFSKTKLATEIRPGMATPCLEWQAGYNSDGYGKFYLDGKDEFAHRVAWFLAHGRWPAPCGLHKCDNPSCVDDEHIFEGTHVDNMHDMKRKGRDRKARGDANGSRLYPESRPRGDANGSRLHPERLARGNANGSRLHPESRPRGENNSSSKLNEDNIRLIFHLRSQGWTKTRTAAYFGVSQVLIGLIIARKLWTHVDLDACVATPGPVS